MEILQAVAQHQTVDFVEDVVPDLHDEVVADAEDVAIEGGVMELAHGQTIRDDRLSSGVAVGKDVRGVEQLGMPQAAKCARVAVRPQHALAELQLMKPLTGQPGDVRPARGVHDVDLEVGPDQLRVVHRHGEGQRGGIVAHDEHGPLREVLTGNDAMEVDERHLLLHGDSQTHVVGMTGVGAAVAVPQEAVRSHLIFVGSRPPRDFRHGGDAQRRSQHGGLEDALGPHKWHAAAVEDEALTQWSDGEHLAVQIDEVGQEAEGRQPYPAILLVRNHADVVLDAVTGAQDSRSGLGGVGSLGCVRQSGDGFVTLDDGTVRWGRFGAAGILVRHVEPETGDVHYFLARRSMHTHLGGTWAVPGGALDSDEDPLTGALREFAEEIGVPLDEHGYDVVHVHEDSYGNWTYWTHVVEVATRFDPPATLMWETAEVRWVRAGELHDLELFDAFRATLGALGLAGPTGPSTRDPG